MIAPLAAALGLDLLFGDPPNRWHPVAWMGHALARGRRHLARGGPRALVVAGAALVLAAIAAAVAVGWGLARAAGALGGAGMLLEAMALKCTFSLRGLARAASAVHAELTRGDLGGARALLAYHLVSRPTATLDAGEVASATVESVAENLADACVGPLLAYAVLGLPGALAYRVVNTADAMFGYREGALEHFGKVAARLDDGLNLVPARLAALAIALAAPVAGGSTVAALRTMWRDGPRTASPNAGWTMAAMAGGLGVAVEKRGAYRLGTGALPTPEDISRSVAVLWVAAAIFAVALVGVWLMFARG